MKKATLLLMLFALVWGGCASSPHVSQDMFLSEHGFVELSNSNYLEAEAYLLAALDINPNNPYTLLNLGVVYQDTGRTKEAVQMYQKILELNPEDTAVESNREGYGGKKIVEIARENLKSLGILIAEKGPAMSTMGLGESVVTDSEVNTAIIQYDVPLQIASYSAAGHASALYTEGNQDTVDIASGGPSGIGASAEGPDGEAADGASGGDPGDSSSGSDGSDGGDSGDGASDGDSSGSDSGGDSSDGGDSGDDGSSSDGDSGTASDKGGGKGGDKGGGKGGGKGGDKGGGKGGGKGGRNK